MQHPYFNCVLSESGIGRRYPQNKTARCNPMNCSHPSAPFLCEPTIPFCLHLNLKTHTSLPKVMVYGVKCGIFYEGHHTSFKFFNHVVQIHFCGLLVVICLRPAKKIGFRIFSKKLKLTVYFSDCDDFWKHIADQAISSTALQIACIVSAKAVVV